MLHFHKTNYSDLVNLNLHTVHYQCNFISLIMNGKQQTHHAHLKVTDHSHSSQAMTAFMAYKLLSILNSSATEHIHVKWKPQVREHKH